MGSNMSSRSPAAARERSPRAPGRLGLVALRRLEDELGARDTARDTITFTVPPEAANVFLLALEAARLNLEAEKQARQTTTDALLWVLDHVIEAWLKQGAAFKDYADFNRDQFRCKAERRERTPFEPMRPPRHQDRAPAPRPDRSARAGDHLGLDDPCIPEAASAWHHARKTAPRQLGRAEQR